MQTLSSAASFAQALLNIVLPNSRKQHMLLTAGKLLMFIITAPYREKGKDLREK